jgi:phosphopantetheine--protein transferase-like protein
MVHSIGVDIEEIDRIKELIDRYGDRFLNKIFTENEIEYCQSKADAVESFAVRFAAKEAFTKAVGKNWSNNISWKDVEVVNDDKGKPFFKFSEKLEKEMNYVAHLSLSHSRSNAVAFVVLERKLVQI